MFRWKPETTDEQIRSIEDGLGGLPDLIPELIAYRFGRDIGVGSGNFDFVVTADFDTLDGYVAYRDHPVHRAIAVDEILPNAAERSAIQFESA